MPRSLVHGPAPALAAWRRTAPCEIAVSKSSPWAAFVDTASPLDLPEGLQQTVLRGRPALGLCVTDMDSTLIEEEVIDELARRAGRFEEVAAITEAAMQGALDFEASLRRRVRALAGTSASVLAEVRGAVRLRPGAERLIRAVHGMGGRAGVVSGGFIEVVGPIAEALDLDFAHAHRLQVANGRLTGQIEGPIVGGPEKASTLRRWASEAHVPQDATLAVGDGANDLQMLKAAGLGVAFCAKPKVRAAADVCLDVPQLDGVLYLWGLDDERIDEAASRG
ncbi:MAG: phosphoserine phosphatase SerB [Myxococcota bacterium]